jgi:hypothetical protein
MKDEELSLKLLSSNPFESANLPKSPRRVRVIRPTRTSAEPFSLSPEQFEKVVENVLLQAGIGLREFKVQRLERMKGSDGVYEIDVTARFEVLGASFLVLIECKHHKDPIKREVVQILHDRIRAVSANKGMIFSTSGFQRGAIEFARSHRIALIKIVDGDPIRGVLGFSCSRSIKSISGGPINWNS